ncbi:MAG: hypothetical protein IJ180_02395 [Bacteroidales bacterium]|nr:hypothetical protein [Bacteroidales bacterium]
MKKRFLVLVASIIVGTIVSAQNEGFKFIGYIQSQVEFAGIDGSTFTGSAYDENRDGDDFYTRAGVRRGLLHFEFTKGKGKGVFEANIREAGFLPLLAYWEVTPYDWLSFRGGLMSVGYGHEIEYSSSNMETMERSLMARKLFPQEHDFGFTATVKYPFNDKRNSLKLSLSAMSGNAINKWVDPIPNFLSHLKYDYKDASTSWGVGLSYYEGRTNNADNVWYEVKDNVWQPKDVEKNKRNARRYFGAEFQYNTQTSWGRTSLRGECSMGKQPSRESNFASQQDNSYNINTPFSYDRKFFGAFVVYTQQIVKTPLSVVLKYQYLNQNTDIASDKVQNVADITYNNIGIGLMYQFNDQIRLHCLYDIYKNKSNDYIKDLNDNILMVRLQYKFVR